MKTALYGGAMGLALAACIVAGLASSAGDYGIATGCIVAAMALFALCYHLEIGRPVSLHLTADQMDTLTIQMADHWDERERQEREALRGNRPSLKSVA